MFDAWLNRTVSRLYDPPIRVEITHTHQSPDTIFSPIDKLHKQTAQHLQYEFNVPTPAGLPRMQYLHKFGREKKRQIWKCMI